MPSILYRMIAKKENSESCPAPHLLYLINLTKVGVGALGARTGGVICCNAVGC